MEIDLAKAVFGKGLTILGANVRETRVKSRVFAVVRGQRVVCDGP